VASPVQAEVWHQPGGDVSTSRTHKTRWVGGVGQRPYAQPVSMWAVLHDPNRAGAWVNKGLLLFGSVVLVIPAIFSSSAIIAAIAFAFFLAVLLIGMGQK